MEDSKRETEAERHREIQIDRERKREKTTLSDTAFPLGHKSSKQKKENSEF